LEVTATRRCASKAIDSCCPREVRMKKRQ
jgi:hypothetical protein